MQETRTRNKEARRQRILDAARDLIAKGGVDAMTTRGLAAAAEVTVPTIYNLVGSRNEVIEAIVRDDFEQVWARLEFDRSISPLAMFERIVAVAYDYVVASPDTHRALAIAADQLAGSQPSQSQFAQTMLHAENRSAAMAEAACEAALGDNLLRGNICAKTLGLQMYTTWRGPFRDWAYGAIDAEEMRRRQLRGFYLTLAADAADAFREELVRKAAALESSSSKILAA